MHLRIKAFYGTSENAVKTQIWIAVSVYVLVAIVRKRLGLEASLYQILQILSLTLFEKTPILRALQTSDYNNDLGDRACNPSTPRANQIRKHVPGRPQQSEIANRTHIGRTSVRRMLASHPRRSGPESSITHGFRKLTIDCDRCGHIRLLVDRTARA